MKVGDLVTIVQSKSDELVSPYTGMVGVIIESQLGKFSNQDSFSVMTRDRMIVIGANYMEVISEGG